MKSSKNTAGIVGILILTAYGVIISELTSSSFVVMLADVISGLSVIGIAVLLAPYFKPFNKNLTTAYLFIKILEGSLMMVGGVLYQFDSLQYLRGAIYDGVHLYTFIVGGYIFYYLLLRSKLVPKFISIWGFLAISTLLLTTVLKIVYPDYPTALDGLLVLIITNEVFLSFWLIFKGFNLPDNKKGLAKSAKK